MNADKLYFAVPALSAFSIVRGSVKENREYTNRATGQNFARVETGARRFDATLTTYQPVVEIVDGKPVVVRYVDLGDDEFSFPEEVPTAQEAAKGPVVVPMAEVADADVIQSLRDVLVEVMTGSIPDFATQDAGMQHIGVSRYFKIDRIDFFGRADKAKEAHLKVLLGVYGDPECTDVKKYILQDFVSAKVIAEKSELLASWKAALSNANAEIANKETSVERRSQLSAEVVQLSRQIAAGQSELDGLKPLSLIFSKPTVETIVGEITESVLKGAAKAKPETYGKISVEQLMARFSDSFKALVAAVSQA